MATWTRQGTGTAPSATDADLVGEYQLDNATAPSDFDPAAVTSIQTQWTITGSGFSDDSWNNDSCAVVGGVSNTELSQHPSAGGTGLQNESESSDHTDSTGIPTGQTVDDWEAAYVRGDGTTIPNEWVDWVKNMGPDGSTLAVSALTVTITYTPTASTTELTGSVSAVAQTTGDLTVDTGSGDGGQITQVGTTQSGAAGNGGDVVLTFDVSPQEDDVVLVFASLGDDSASGTEDPTPTDYSKLTPVEYIDTNQGAGGVSYKVMGATPDTSVTVPGTGFAQDSLNGHAYVLRGVDTANVEDAAEAFRVALSTEPDPDPSAITTATDNAWVFVMMYSINDDTGITEPTGYSTAVVTGQVDTERSNLATAFLEIPTAGTEDPGQWTWGNLSVEKGLFTVAIRPATTAGTTTELSGTSEVVSSLDASLTQEHNATGSITAVSESSVAPLSITRQLSGSIAAVNEVAASLDLTHRVSAQVQAVASLSSAFTQAHHLSSSLTAVSESSAVISQAHNLDAAPISAVSEVSASMATTHSLSSSISAVSQISASLSEDEEFTGLVQAVASVDAAPLHQDHNLSSSISAVASVSGSLAIEVTRLLNGTVSAAAAADGSVSQVHQPSSSLAATSQVSAFLAQVHALGASVSTVSESSADLTVAGSNLRPLNGSISAVAATSSSLHLTYKLSASTSAVSTTSAQLTQVHALSGSVSVVSESSASLDTRATVSLSGSVSAVASVSGAPVQTHSLSGAVSAVTSTSASLSVSGSNALSNSISAVASNTAQLSVTSQLSGSLSTVASTSASLTVTAPTVVISLAGSSSAVASSFVTLHQRHRAVAVITGVSRVRSASLGNVSPVQRGRVSASQVQVGNVALSSQRVHSAAQSQVLVGSGSQGEVLVGSASVDDNLSGSVQGSDD